MTAGHVCDKLDMHNKSNVFFEDSIKHYKSIAYYFESKEDYNTVCIFLMLCMKLYGQKHEQTALCYEHAAELQAKMGVEDQAMNLQRMANILRDKYMDITMNNMFKASRSLGALVFLLENTKGKRERNER